MTLLKSEQKTPMLIPYLQLYIQTYHQNGHLIPKQHPGDANTLFQLIIDMLPTTDTIGKTNQHTNTPAETFQHTHIKR